MAGKDTFLKTTWEIAEYVGREFDDAGEFRTGMVELALPALVAPTCPANANNAFEVEIWKMDQREFMAKE